MSKIFPFSHDKTHAFLTPYALRQKYPISCSQQHLIDQTRHDIKQILKGKDSRKVLIVGPCSIHDIISAKEYAEKLSHIRKEVEDTFVVIMRVYCEKPRTRSGWKGLMYDPFLDGSYNIATGLHWTRKLMLDLADMQIPIACEFLDPNSAHYFDDLVSWGCIGARTSESQIHRQLASGLPTPVGFKNNTDGNIQIAVNGVLSATTPHSFIGTNPKGVSDQICTEGNPFSHIVLRGGRDQSNYDPESIQYALNLLHKSSLPSRVFIDCSHDNSRQNHTNQPTVFRSVIDQIQKGNHAIHGILLESNLFSSNQTLSDASALQYGVSVTDPCLDWKTTEDLIYWSHQKFKEKNDTKPLSNPVFASLATNV